MGIIRDSFLILKEWKDALKGAPDEVRLKCYELMFEYAETGVKPESDDWQTNMFLGLIATKMQYNIEKWQLSVENGKKGGRPPKEKNPEETQKNPDETQIQNLKTQQNPDETLYDCDCVFKLVNKENNNISHEGAGARVRERDEKERQPYLLLFEDYFSQCFTPEWREAGLEIIDTMIEAREQALSEGLKFNHRTYSDTDVVKVITQIPLDAFRSTAKQIKLNQEIKNRPYYILGCLVNAVSGQYLRKPDENTKSFLQLLEV